MKSSPPNFIEEKLLFKQGYAKIAGVDEVGRGCLAGPVVAACVILPKNFNLPGLRDSKACPPKKRAKLFAEIKAKCLDFGIGIVDQTVIDKINILKASLLAMKKAIENLKTCPDFILVDGNMIVPNLDLSQKSIIKGDTKVISIACASIIAKVIRDEMMAEFHKSFPQYGFAKHKGYGTKEHRSAILKFGPCTLHRRSFQLYG